MTDPELELILKEGEGYRIEFKENLSGIDKEIVAFANASGGFIYIGITDDRKIKGIEIGNKVKSQVQDISRNCDPAINIIIEEYKNILIVEVREGTDKPYKCTSGFYNRIGPNSQKMNRDEILEFVKSEGKIRFDELIKKDFSFNDFDDEKFSRFLKMAGITRVVDTEVIIKNLHAGEIQQGTCLFYNTAVLFSQKISITITIIPPLHVLCIKV